MRDRSVYVFRAAAPVPYPEQPPFHPGRRYPEYEFEVGTEANHAYEAVRSCFRLAELDRGNYDTALWNPLGALIRPGETVLLKPNLVREWHPRDEAGWRYILTHGSVIRAAADYVWKALDYRGTVIVADAPQTDASFPEITRQLGLDAIRRHYLERSLDFRVIDLRREEWRNRDGVIVSRRPLPGDPSGGVAFDLGADSEFHDHRGAGRYYGADYDADVVNHHHSGGRHEYLIAGSAIRCDVVFSLPKLKTHKKVGITVGLKNLVGVNGDKNWLPHHTEGEPAQGGDEHPSPDRKHKAERTIVPLFRRLSLRIPVVGPWLHRQARLAGQRVFGDSESVIRSGNWWGNDTAWRMCLDLNKALLYGNADGSLRAGTPGNRKRHIALVDGLLAGEGQGPLNPDPVEAGVILFGANVPSVDATAAYLMGFDPAGLRIVHQAFRCRSHTLADWDWPEVQVVSNWPDWNGCLGSILDRQTFHFKAPFGWVGHIEREHHRP
jgi:uncharacterized protein (DUF362 family)